MTQVVGSKSEECKTFSVREIATQIKAQVHGDDTLRVTDIQPLDSATQGDLTFLGNDKNSRKRYFALAKQSQASAILINEYESSLKTTQIITADPLRAIVGLASVFQRPLIDSQEIHPTACIDKTAIIAQNVYIGPYSVIGRNVRIGTGSIIHPHVVIYAGANIGDNCIIHSSAVIREMVNIGSNCLIQNGAIIGGDGFGYIPDPELGHRRIPHIGNVVLEDGVDIGANSTVDRATLGESRLGRNTKIDNLVMLGHNAKVGERTIMCAQVGVSGSCTIGNDVILAGQVGVSDHTRIGNKVTAAGQSGVNGEVPDGSVVGGTPHTDVGKWHRSTAMSRNLPNLLRRLKKLEKRIEDLNA